MEAQRLPHTRPAIRSAAERFGVWERPDLSYTPAVAKETEHLYERVRDFIRRSSGRLCALYPCHQPAEDGARRRHLGA